MTQEVQINQALTQIGLDIKQIKADIPDTTSSPVATVADAQGSTLGLQQELLASQGQVGKTVLAVAYSFWQGSEVASPDHKAQITSLGAGNVVFVYATGSDFTNRNPQEGPVFLADGEIYVIENVASGAIITASEGAYGYSQQRQGGDASPMPLMSFALSFTDTFLFAFRNCQVFNPGSDVDNQGFIHVVNGPIASTIQLRNGAGNVVQGQEDIALAPWQYYRLYTNANGEYRLTSTNKIMCAHNANMGVNTPRFWDSRLVLPLTVDGMSWPRSGFLSALYSGTVARNFVNDKTSSGPSVSDTFTINPGSPVDWDSGATTGANDADYEPRGATRVLFSAPGSGYSGADSAGLEASPLCPTSTFTQKIALPLHIRNSGDGGNNGIAICGPYVGKGRLYEWNQVTNEVELVTVNDPSGNPTTEIEIIRRNDATEFSASTRSHQNHPASALISAQGSGGSDPGAYDLIEDFNGGYIEFDVPVMCVFNCEQNENGASDHTFRGTSGNASVGIAANDDEQLSYGIIPETIRAEVTQREDGVLVKRVIDNTNSETWQIA